MNLKTNTRYSLGIFSDGEEVDGFTMYAYWPREQIVPTKLELKDSADWETKFSRLGGNSWTVGVWDIRIRKWPSSDHWRPFILSALHQVLKSGSLASWCAVEGAFADPPNLFDPQFMSGGVWAASTSDGLQFGPPALDAPFETLTDEQLRTLQSHVMRSSGQ
jgi:hypothetical protein